MVIHEICLFVTSDYRFRFKLSKNLLIQRCKSFFGRNNKSKISKYFRGRTRYLLRSSFCCFSSCKCWTNKQTNKRANERTKGVIAFSRNEICARVEESSIPRELKVFLSIETKSKRIFGWTPHRWEAVPKGSKQGTVQCDQVATLFNL